MKTVRGRYPKGVSGNPAGRPQGAINKASAKLKALLHALDEAAVARLAEIIQSKRLWLQRPEVVLRAIELAWAYGHGRPRPQVDEEEWGEAHSEPLDLLTILTAGHRMRDEARGAAPRAQTA
jgi:hypothetical protein